MLNHSDAYRYLIAQAGASTCDFFDTHVLACALSRSLVEVGAGGTFADSLGLSLQEVLDLSRERFPGLCERLLQLPITAAEPDIVADERMLREILRAYCSDSSPLTRALPAIIARRAQQPHHLWQDLGLRNRRELSWLMERHFAGLAARNQRDMKWKKFLYRMICRDTGYTLCVAPSCEECGDYDACFGDETDGDGSEQWLKSLETVR